jgi:hypothetical protein
VFSGCSFDTAVTRVISLAAGFFTARLGAGFACDVPAAPTGPGLNAGIPTRIAPAEFNRI